MIRSCLVQKELGTRNKHVHSKVSTWRDTAFHPKMAKSENKRPSMVTSTPNVIERMQAKDAMLECFPAS